MSKISYCPRGGQIGVFLTHKELKEFADKNGKEYIDVIIPLPESQQILSEDCKKNHAEMEDAMYWETDKGGHGWCCSVCGEVLQWG